MENVVLTAHAVMRCYIAYPSFPADTDHDLPMRSVRLLNIALRELRHLRGTDKKI